MAETNTEHLCEVYFHLCPLDLEPFSGWNGTETVCVGGLTYIVVVPVVCVCYIGKWNELFTYMSCGVRCRDAPAQDTADDGDGRSSCQIGAGEKFAMLVAAHPAVAECGVHLVFCPIGDGVSVREG